MGELNDADQCDAQQGCRNTARPQEIGGPPVHRMLPGMHGSADDFRDGAVRQVCANGDDGFNAHHKDHDRGHKRTAAHAREPDEETDGQTDEGKTKIHRLSAGTKSICNTRYICKLYRAARLQANAHASAGGEVESFTLLQDICNGLLGFAFYAERSGCLPVHCREG